MSVGLDGETTASWSCSGEISLIRNFPLLPRKLAHAEEGGKGKRKRSVKVKGIEGVLARCRTGRDKVAEDRSGDSKLLRAYVFREQVGGPGDKAADVGAFEDLGG